MADPAFRGFVESTLDALLIFEGCRRGVLPKITRRLQEFEKRALVTSGAVFIFDEEETGIKRWTDGLTWSPSRTLGNFLVYRELDKKVVSQPAAAEDASISASDPDALEEEGAADAEPVASTSSYREDPVASTSRRRSSTGDLASLASASAAQTPLDRHRERALVGSLTSSSRFRPDGLVKKTISLSGLHMIGYYKIDDVTSGRLRTPSSHAELVSLEISSIFLASSLFRLPPVTEMGEDGQLRYKGESDTPMSPLTRSGSSQGHNTPALGTTRSRPASSESSGNSAHRGGSPHLSSLGGQSSQRDLHSPPGSPHRGGVAPLRSVNRFDPYYVSRSSPNLASYPHNLNSASNPSYPFPNQHSPNRATFATFPEDLSRSVDGLPAPPPLAPLALSAPPTQQHWNSLQPLPSQKASSIGRTTLGDQATYYQPRQPLPFSPHIPSNDDTPSGNNVFAYQPPPPPPLPLHSSHRIVEERPSSDSPIHYPYPPAQAASPLHHTQQPQHRPDTPSHSQDYSLSYAAASQRPSQAPYRPYSLPDGAATPFFVPNRAIPQSQFQRRPESLQQLHSYTLHRPEERRESSTSSYDGRDTGEERSYGGREYGGAEGSRPSSSSQYNGRHSPAPVQYEVSEPQFYPRTGHLHAPPPQSLSTVPPQQQAYFRASDPSAYSQPNPYSSYPSQPSPSQHYPQQADPYTNAYPPRLPSGLVMPRGSPEEDERHGQVGLGLGQERLGRGEEEQQQQQQFSVKREPDDEGLQQQQQPRWWPPPGTTWQAPADENGNGVPAGRMGEGEYSQRP